MTYADYSEGVRHGWPQPQDAPKEAIRLTLTLDYDQDAENPIQVEVPGVGTGGKEGGWQLISFNRRHSAFGDPTGIVDRDGVFHTAALRSKEKAGTAFVLGYYEHGLCQWSISGEGQKCYYGFDSVSVAGALIWHGKAADLAKGKDAKKQREVIARSLLASYTDYCNGNVYYFNLEHKDGTPVDACSGFFGHDKKYLVQTIREAIEQAGTENPNAPILLRVKGNATMLLDAADFGCAEWDDADDDEGDDE